MAEPDTLIGQTFSHYRIIEQVGSGGMGVVYRARDEHLHREVAIKVIHQRAVIDERARKLLQKEAVTLSRLNHPNIATVYDFDNHQGLDFLVMEYVDGRALSRSLSCSPLTEKEVAILGMQMAQALEEAHEHGVIHRDLKPANILITSKGQVKVLDFGLAKLFDPTRGGLKAETLTQSVDDSHLLGTLPYVAPEQVSGEHIDARTDIYGLGVVLYEMATHQRPFREQSTPRLFDSILHQAAVPPRALNPRISAEMERIILKCLEKEPADRYQSATEMAIDLRQLRTGVLTAPQPAARHVKWSSAKSVGLSVGILASVIVLLIAFNIGNWRDRLLGRAAVPRIKSLAVLPLANLSGDPAQEYFSDGMTEELITDLSRISALRVISRTSVMQYKGAKKPMPQIAKELNVETVLEGSVQREGEIVRITAQLIEGRTDRHLWGGSYERDLGDVLALQSDVARAIAREIKVVVTPQEQARLTTTHSVNLEAHEAYLKGRFFWNKRTPEGFDKAVDFFQQAIEIDPTYAQAYAGLADSYTLMEDYGLLLPNRDYPRAKAAAVKAVELDETLAEAHTALAAVMEDYDYDWSGAEREYKRAIELNPSYETAHQWYGALLSTLGRHQEALAEAKRARELAPLSARINLDVGWAFYWTRLYDEARAESRKTLDLDPNFAPAYTLLGWTSVRKHLFEEAIAEFQKAINLSGDSTANHVAIAYARAMAGETGKALTMLDELKKRSKYTPVSSYQMAIIYVGLGEKGMALESLEMACEGEHYKWIGFLEVDPSFDPLSSEPRFKRLLRRMNLPS